MWFNSTQREEPYQVLTSLDDAGNSISLRSKETGGAWLSSARVVRCWVKSRNERNPYGQLLRKRTLARLPLTKRRKVGMTSNHHALYDLGYTRTTMALNKEKQDREVEQNSETTSQFGLQAATRLHEVGIASNRRSACHGEYVPGPCTRRPGTHSPWHADTTILAIPTSCRRVAACSPNWDVVSEFCSTSRSCFSLFNAIVVRV